MPISAAMRSTLSLISRAASSAGSRARAACVIVCAPIVHSRSAAIVATSLQSMTRLPASAARSSPCFSASARIAFRCVASSASVVSHFFHRRKARSFSCRLRVASFVAPLPPGTSTASVPAMIRSSASHQSSDVRSREARADVDRERHIVPAEDRPGMREIVAIAVVEGDCDAARIGPTARLAREARRPKRSASPRR